MNVLSLFDGMSCGRLALDRAGITVNKYYASEIDKWATKVSDANYPDIIRLGDINNWKSWDLEKIDLIIAGSPCQGFSFAGKQLAFDDPRSALFFTFLDILNTIKAYNPSVKFMLENVRMKKEHLDVITDKMGVEPVMINSALVSAQNRVRFYWCNWDIEQPNDKGILLKDIIEYDTDPKYDLSQKLLDANYYKGASWEQYKTKRRRQQVLCNQVGIASDIKGNDSIKRIYGTDGKSPCLTTMGGGHREPKILNLADNHRVKGITVNERGIRPHRGDDRKTGISEIGRICFKTSKTDCLSTSHQPKVIISEQKDNLVMLDKTQYRKLTPLECERLQTVPDNYTNHVSNTQRYKMLGNGWTVDVIAHLFKGLK